MGHKKSVGQAGFDWLGQAGIICLILLVKESIICRRVSMNPTRTLFSRMKSLASKRLLNDGNAIPCVGFGVYNSRPGKETEQSVLWALDVSCVCHCHPTRTYQHGQAGYRHIDTATIYENEKSVGDALKKT